MESKTKKILKKYVNEMNITNIIMDYLDLCDICKRHQKKSLTIGIGSIIGSCDLKNTKKSDYQLRKFCDECIYFRCSKLSIYVDNNYKKIDY